MPVREIKTSLALDGEKAFKQAIADASRQLRVMNADLKAVAAEFDLTGDKEQMLTQKSGILKTEISQQEKIVEALNRAVRESAEAFGDSSDKTDGYRIKLSNAKASLSKLKSELQDADREAEEFGRDSVKVGRQIEDGIGDSAEDAEKSVKGLIERMSEDIGSIKGSAAFTVSTSIMGSVTDVVQGVMGFVEENRDYRRQLSYLQSAAKNAGKDWVDVQEFLFQIASLTGDMDGAFEATSNLLKTGLDNAGIQNAIDLFTGAGILWGDTFRIENLAESFQESVATGEATGAYAELIERLGKDLESYKELMKSQDELTRAQGSLTFISDSGLIPTAEEYKQRNNELIEAQRAQIELTQAWAELAEDVEPIVTAMQKAATYIVKGLSTLLNTLAEAVGEDMIESFTNGDEEKKKTAQEALKQGLITEEEAFTYSMGDVSLGMPFTNTATGLYNLFLHQEQEKIGEKIESAMPEEDFAQAAGEAYGEAYAEGVVNGFQNGLSIPTDLLPIGVFAEYAGKSVDAITGGEIFDENSVYNRPLNETLGAIFGESETGQHGGGSGKSFDVTVTPMPDEDPEVNEAFEGLGASNGASYDQGLNAAMDQAIENAKISGVNLGVSIGNGITEATPGAVAAANALANSVSAALAGLTGGINLGVGSYTAGNLTANINMDGRRVGQYISPIISNYLGQSASRTQRVG